LFNFGTTCDLVTRSLAFDYVVSKSIFGFSIAGMSAFYITPLRRLDFELLHHLLAVENEPSKRTYSIYLY
jgi:hypothetical protein